MARKPNYEELEQRIKELEQESAKRKRVEEALREGDNEAKRLARENAIVAEIGSIINSSLDIEDVYEQFAEEVRKLIPFDRISINLVDRKGNCTRLAYVNGTSIPSRGKGDAVSLEGSPSRVIIDTRKSMLIPTGEFKNYAERFPAFLLTVQAGFQSLMLVPLISKDEVIAILHFRSIQPNRYSEEELRLAGRVGYQITSAIVNAQIFAERKRAEEALRQSKERYRSLFDEAPVGYMEYDTEGRITRVNQREMEILGYTAEEMVGEPVWNFVVGKEAEETIKAKLAGDKPPANGLERTYRRKDGTMIPVLIDDMINRDREGRVTGIRSTIQDITDRKQAEDALRESEERYRIAIEGSNDGVAIVQNFAHVYMNQRFVHMFGYERLEELEGKPRYFNVHPDDLERVKNYALMRAKSEDVPAQYRFKGIRKDGTSIDVEVSVNMILYHGETAILAYLRDITDRKLAEEALRKSEDRYRTILESIEEGYYEVDIAGNLTFFNDSMFELLGYSKDELMGMNNRQYTDKENAKTLYRAFNEVFKTGKPTKGFDWEVIRKDGTTRFVEASVSLIRDSGDTPIGFRGIVRDITERKRAEEEKEKLQTQLQRAQKMEAIGTLAGGVAHDLNNILSGIVSYPDLLLMQLPENSPLRKPLATIQESGKRAAAIVQDLLTLARRAVPTAEVVNLNDMISEYLKSPEHEKLRSFHPDVQLETHLDTGLLNVLGSPVHLSKTVMNLVSNAAEAMPHGGKVLISTENRYIDSSIRRYEHVEEGDYVTLSVSDTGVGISSEGRERIFEPFYTKKVMGRSGTGLGMAVVWGTVKDHKGYIDIQSSEGKGAIFTLYFPVTRKELVKDKFIFPIEEYKGKGESILVVDDVEGQRDIASALLSHLGYSVTTVSSGEEAVGYMKNTAVDLVVLDMIMDPGIDGLETYKQILEMHPKQKAIIASGFSETRRVSEAQRLGAGQYVKKPYTLEKIGVAVRKELDR